MIKLKKKCGRDCENLHHHSSVWYATTIKPLEIQMWHSKQTLPNRCYQQEVRVAFPILWCPSEADLYPLGTSHQFPQTALARRTKSQLKTTDWKAVERGTEIMFCMKQA